MAVCGFCSSTIARDGETLRNIGKMAELFDDFSPLQLGTSGKYSGITFTLIGRLQYKYSEGAWNEWYAYFDNGTNGWLSEDNGRYVLSFDVKDPKGLPAVDTLKVGGNLAVNGSNYTISSVEEVSLMSAQGELPYAPKIGPVFMVADLRNDRGEVMSLDYSNNPPNLSVGKSASLEDLKLTNLREEADKSLKANAFNCPTCGASVEVKLAGTQSITCGSCASVIDVSKGVGADITAFKQTDQVVPAIPLGSVGKLQGVDWQVVGFQQREGTDSDQEVFYWAEYLLFNKLKGFTFLVTSTEGWSLVSPLTGAPKFKNPGSGGATVQVNGRTYAESYRYKAKVTYVAGEFYWRVKEGQITNNIDFAAGQWLLSQEKTDKELTYSEGQRIAAKEVGAAFGLKDFTDAAPASSSSKSLVTFIIVIIVILVVLALMSRCSSSSSTGYVGGGGGYGSSYGGSGGGSGGGGHK